MAVRQAVISAAGTPLMVSRTFWGRKEKYSVLITLLHGKILILQRYGTKSHSDTGAETGSDTAPHSAADARGASA